MTDLLEKAVAAVCQMPAAERDTIAEAMLSVVKLAEPLDIEPERLAVATAGMAQAVRGECVEREASEIGARAFPRPKGRIRLTLQAEAARRPSPPG